MRDEKCLLAQQYCTVDLWVYCRSDNIRSAGMINFFYQTCCLFMMLPLLIIKLYLHKNYYTKPHGKSLKFLTSSFE